MIEHSVRFSAVGDITFGDHPLCIGFGAFSKFRRHHPIFPFQHVHEHLQNSDLTFGNLECVLSQTGTYSNEYNSIQMRGLSAQIGGLVESGFNILNFANNHCLQHGEQSFLSTLKLLKENGIHYCGVNLDDHQVGIPTVIEINTIKIAFLGYSLRPRQYFSKNPLYSEGSTEGIIQDIRTAKESANKVIVSLHWGDEFIDSPSPFEIDLGRKLIDAGANIIIGHHPHVLRGIEYHKKGIIIYSLGNFICDMIWDRRLRESLIFHCTITQNGIEKIDFTPIYINEFYQPTVLTGSQSKQLLTRVHELSKTVSDESLTNFKHKQNLYKKEADLVQNIYRRKGHTYLIINLFRYSPLILFGHIKTFLRNRFNEFFNKQPVHRC